MKKTKYSFFHKPSQKEDIPLLLPKLIINNYEIKRTQSIKFFLGGEGGFTRWKLKLKKKTLKKTKLK